jgi:hypothetical protein
MYLVSEKSEGLFLRKRQNTVKAAIQEGNINPQQNYFNGRTEKNRSCLERSNTVEEASWSTSILFILNICYCMQ